MLKKIFVIVSALFITTTAYAQCIWTDNPRGPSCSIIPQNGSLTLGTASNPFGNIYGTFVGSLTNPTVAGNLTFSTAAAEIIPGATSLTFRNHADSASNLSITDAGIISIRDDLVVTTTGKGVRMSTSDASDDAVLQVTGGGAFGATRGARITLAGNEASGQGGDIYFSAGDVATGDLLFQTKNQNQWQIPYSSNANLLFAQANAYIMATTSDAADSAILNIAGGGNNTAPRGAFMTLAGNEASGGGSINLYGGNAGSASSINFVLNHASANIQFYNASTAVMWSINNSGNLSQDATNGANILINRAGTGIDASGNSSYLTIRGATSGVEFRDKANSNSNLLILDSGALSIRNTFTSSRATDLGWTPVNAANQACNTTCTSACVFGMNTGALGNFVGCADATADTCICAGAS